MDKGSNTTDVLEKGGVKISKLKLCPFCGGEAKQSVGMYDNNIEYANVRCLECPAELAMNASVDYTATDEVVKRWNTRLVQEQHKIGGWDVLTPTPFTKAYGVEELELKQKENVNG